MYQMKPVKCNNCKHYIEDKNYKGEGVCNLLTTNEDKRAVKINKYK